MAPWLVCLTLDLAVRVRAPAVMFFGKTLNSDSVSFHPGAQILMGADECKAGGNFAMASGISSEGSRNTLSHFMLQKPIEKLPPKWLFGSNADLTFFTIISIAGYQ